MASQNRIGEEVSFRKSYLSSLCLLLSLFLYTLSFPSILHTQGVPQFGYVAIAPLIFLSYHITFREALWYSVIFGALFSTLFAWWTRSYFPPALFGAAMITGVSFLPILPAFQYISKRSYIAPLIHPFVWVAFEYLRTKGVLGNPFGVLGYSQFRSVELIQIAQYVGVWGVSLLVITPSALLAGLVQRRRPVHPFVFSGVGVIWVVLFGGAFVFGSVSLSRDSYVNESVISVALIQHNPPAESLDDEIDRLIDLSYRALVEEPDLVVWPESVVELVLRPGYQSSRGAEVYDKIQSFQLSSGVPLLFGAFDQVEEGGPVYNSALLMEKGTITGSWNKKKLVPFIEYSPVRWFSPLHRGLEKLGFGTLSPDISFDPILLELDSGEVVSIGAPICFEESFGHIVSRQINEGAKYLINLTNDSWADGEYAQWQHFAMAVFRAVEQQSMLVRSASSGVSGKINQRGEWLDTVIPPLELGFLVVDLSPVPEKPTLYRLWGDWFALLCVLVSSVGFLFLRKSV